MADPVRTPEELRYRLYLKLIDVLGMVVVYGFKYGTLAFIAYTMGHALEAYAGRTTFADVGFKLLGDFKINEWIAYMFGLGGIALWWKERRLRQNTVERMAANKEAAEKKLDPQRSSSGLTARGTSRPEDEE